MFAIRPAADRERPVLSFLNFFKRRACRAIVETGLRRAGRYREMISAACCRGGPAAGPDLTWRKRKALSSRWPLSRAAARGVWHSWPTAGSNTPAAHLVDR